MGMGLVAVMVAWVLVMVRLGVVRVRELPLPSMRRASGVLLLLLLMARMVAWVSLMLWSGVVVAMRVPAVGSHSTCQGRVDRLVSPMCTVLVLVLVLVLGMRVAVGVVVGP